MGQGLPGLGEPFEGGICFAEKTIRNKNHFHRGERKGRGDIKWEASVRSIPQVDK